MLGPGWNSGEFGSVDRKVRSLLYRGALLVAAIGLLAEAPAPTAPSDEAAHVFALTGSRTAPVQSYTSKLHLDFALRRLASVVARLVVYPENMARNLAHLGGLVPRGGFGGRARLRTPVGVGSRPGPGDSPGRRPGIPPRILVE